MSLRCCILVDENGNVKARQCVDGFCPSGWTTTDVDDCSQCPSYPSGPDALAMMEESEPGSSQNAVA
jgi:hypothetical protein